MKKQILLFVMLVSLLMTKTWAGGFVVKKIEVEGLQRISVNTVYSYLPIQKGELLRPEKTGAIIAALYRTGFFEHIALAREGDVLIIKVVERSTIGQLKISGNSYLPTDKLTTVMKSVDIAEGRVYNSAVLEKIKQSLLNQYYLVGRYNARVDLTVTQMERNRVLIKIDISEGLIAKVRRINIIGNHAFDESALDKQLELTTPGLLTFFTQTDRYSEDKLESSLEKVRNYYMNRGYLRFVIKSTQVAITPDRKSIFITLVVDEGALYTVKGFTVVGDTILPRAEILKRVGIEPGSHFSRQAVLDAEKSISDAIGNVGYIFATVNLQPKVDEATKQVYLVFTVNPGKRAYVRHIYFTDNAKTNDEALRREVQQMESSVVSTKKLEQSKHQLSLLPYLRDVQMSVVPVQDSDNKVDVNYKVTEDPAASATFSVGYSQLDHLILSAGLNQKNFLGTGKTLGLSVSRSRPEQYFGLNYTDPYYTADGVSRSINLSATKYNPHQANSSGSYRADQYNLSVVYGIPLGQEKDVFNRLQLGYGVDDTVIRLYQPVSNQVQAFTNNNGRHFQQLDLISGFSRDSRDKAIFPTKGMLHTLGINAYLPATADALRYYTVVYNGKWYQPLVPGFVAVARGDLGFGSSLQGGAKNFPFFRNFFAGGIESVRGYGPNSLGPKDNVLTANNPTGTPTGGNALIDGCLGVVFPNHVSENLRTTVFVDGGNVYNTFDNRVYGGSASGVPRFSMGIEADWLTPMGMIDVALAKRLNPQPHDSAKFFDFSLGANFG